MTCRDSFLLVGKVLVSLVPMGIALLVAGVPMASRYSPDAELRTAMMPTGVRTKGMHLYGWDASRYGLYGSWPSHPEVDGALGMSTFRRDLTPYITKLKDKGDKPNYILDLMAVGRGGILHDRRLADGQGYPSLGDLDHRIGGQLLRDYREIRRTQHGVLYERRY